MKASFVLAWASVLIGLSFVTPGGAAAVFGRQDSNSTTSLTIASVTSTTSSTSLPAISTATTLAGCTPTGATFVVNPTPTACEFSSIQSAINALPNDSAAKTILIASGIYTEQLSITRNGKVALRGNSSFPNDFTQNQVTVQYLDGVSTSADEDETTPVVHVKKSDSSGVALYNIDFINLFPQTHNFAALASDFSGTNIAVYGCKFVGFQDTFLANKGVQVVSNSYIEGSVDFIWGFSAAYFSKCFIAANTPGGSICAQSRSAGDSTGYVFDKSYITYTSTYGNGTTYLARPYDQYSRVVYMHSYLDSNINPAGWSVWETTNPQTSNVTFAEYQNYGPGSSTAQRANFSTVLTASQAAAYSLSSFIGNTSWLDMDAFNLIPSYETANGTVIPSKKPPGPTAFSCNVTLAASTMPQAGDFVVSKTPISNMTVYANISAAIAALPTSSSVTPTIFIYPGLYEEQIVFNRKGSAVFRGYSASPCDNSQNEVTIQNAVAVNTQADESNSNSATLYDEATQLSMFNINLDNVFGTTYNYASLGFAIGNSGLAAFYSCQIRGNQDTFDLGTGTNVFASNTLIEGSVDFIWNTGALYCLGCQLVPNHDGGCITADKRANNMSLGGMTFDQCTIEGTADPGTVFLGRPYSQYAKVAYINSYLDDTISPAGWSIWETTNPQTDGVIFGEYENYGPGAGLSMRANFSMELTTAELAQFQIGTLLASTSWIDFDYVPLTPFSV